MVQKWEKRAQSKTSPIRNNVENLGRRVWIVIMYYGCIFLIV